MSEEFSLADELASLPEDVTSTKLPEVGTYLVEIVTAEARTSNNGVPNLNFRVKFIGGAYAGRSEFLTIWYSKKSEAGIAMFWRQLKAVGIDNDWITRNKATLADAARQAVGAQVEVRLTHDEWNGETRAKLFPNKFKGVNPDARVGLSTVDDSFSTPEVAALPDLDDDAPAAPVNTTKEPATVPAGAGAAAAVDEDDPWG